MLPGRPPGLFSGHLYSNYGSNKKKEFYFVQRNNPEVPAFIDNSVRLQSSGPILVITTSCWQSDLDANQFFIKKVLKKQQSKMWKGRIKGEIQQFINQNQSSLYKPPAEGFVDSSPDQKAGIQAKVSIDSSPDQTAAIQAKTFVRDCLLRPQLPGPPPGRCLNLKGSMPLARGLTHLDSSAL